MDKKLEAALNNMWVVVRATKMNGDEHDQLKADFALIGEALKKQEREPEQDAEGE